jgi:hypothetical protein
MNHELLADQQQDPEHDLIDGKGIRKARSGDPKAGELLEMSAADRGIKHKETGKRGFQSPCGPVA